MKKNIDPNLLVDNHGDYLFRYALVKVKDKTLADDLVQETYLAAVKSAVNYKGESTERTWLTAILKNKIVDYYRKYNKDVAFDSSEIERLDTERFFEREDGWNGFWNRKFRPAGWKISPQSALENKDFYTVLEKCLDELPDKMEQVFRLREMEELESDEIREAFNLSSSNYWVILHRARFSLRRCIEVNWFSPETE